MIDPVVLSDGWFRIDVRVMVSQLTVAKSAAGSSFLQQVHIGQSVRLRVGALLLSLFFPHQDIQAMDDAFPQDLNMKPAIERLFDAYQERDELLRRKLLSASVSEVARYWQRDRVLYSIAEISDQIEAWHDEDTERAPRMISDIQTFRNVARVAWSQKMEGLNNFQKGESFFELDVDGLLTTIVNFSDPPHDVIIEKGPESYIKAWNSETLLSRQAQLESTWSQDARWVEIRFDVTGPAAIAETMKAPIVMESVDGVMDELVIEGVGRQIRFQVDVTHKEGHEIGRFTDFVFEDESGQTRLLAGFRGASLSMKHKTSVVDPSWHRAYISGYRDAGGRFAGGSEVMHLASHRNRLYAANGYWEDSHYKVPEGAPVQSAQILRLDEPSGQFQVDLDMGEASPPGINIMKGNLLKVIRFTHQGKESLPEPVDILFAAASNIRTMTRVWTLDDESGLWHGETVGQGEFRAGVRWVPRDVEVFTDSVTGEQRVFLLLGNVGVLSGMYDPSRESRIRWDEQVEFPDDEALEVRALGMVEANGSLYFSAGSLLFERQDGPTPTYKEVLDLRDDQNVNVEMGGIRGLSAISNPNGGGESLIFLWTPHGKSQGEVLRLDPLSDGSYERHTEVVIGDLVQEHISRRAIVNKVLGAYNDFYEITRPDGTKLHVIGFQVQLMGSDDIVGQERYYKGGIYALRTEDGRYILGEINGPYEPGKSRLVAPRSFVVSPFGDDHIYAAGYDSNFMESTGMAWIFNAHRDVWLKPLD
ncbi:MAG: hypothetical protein ACFHX7_12775 [Pseudomonadota bacterium]